MLRLSPISEIRISEIWICEIIIFLGLFKITPVILSIFLLKFWLKHIIIFLIFLGLLRIYFFAIKCIKISEIVLVLILIIKSARYRIFLKLIEIYTISTFNNLVFIFLLILVNFLIKFSKIPKILLLLIIIILAKIVIKASEISKIRIFIFLIIIRKRFKIILFLSLILIF